MTTTMHVWDDTALTSLRTLDSSRSKLHIKAGQVG